MALEIVGKLQQLLPLQSGSGAKGDWSKQNFIIETIEQYPRKVRVSAWGDKARDLDGVGIGETLRISVNIESREFNGGWYTDVRAWRIQRDNESQQVTTSSSSVSAPIPPTAEDYSDFGAADEVDDLPF
ncbi:MAG: DUF3127 domain-containing protein [Prevotellaceae bacterium]|jgi:hypothetical protein|nr:DUF3127 domain-containing protein [Prevotellaceae bacterium]